MEGNGSLEGAYDAIEKEKRERVSFETHVRQELTHIRTALDIILATLKLYEKHEETENG